ncbi:choice-of-anchor I family protein [Bacillus sp. NTK071]|uniref:choice-of-anchor I family protein n=1 Tax=Bacillus sp. NTK071 TaxID=2802175 RepID=UPI001A8FB286|nr:choice-of-anchor I family protein [Bacillus sp. NTK071]MBN8209083.1 choice-of-anchor I family protein [Bacillus sp. NTK071]
MKKTPLALATIVSLSLVSGYPSSSSAEMEQLTTYPDQEELSISLVGRYKSGAALDEGGAEIVDYDKKHQRAFVVNGADQSLDILDLSSSTENNEIPLYKKVFLKDIDLGSFVPGDLTSVAVHPTSEYVAVAIPAEEKTDKGMVALFQTDGEFIKAYEVGSLPDMVTFSPNGKQLIVANEGEPNDDYSVDPEGSVSIIDVSNGSLNANVNTVGFSSLDEEKIDEDVRVFSPNATPAQDFEPEYIQVTPDNRKAYISLQENNAIAELDLETQTFTSVNSLGFKDHSMEGNGLDASNKSDEVDIKPMPVLGMYQPDGIVLYTVEGRNYIITPNEGDSRDYTAYSEETRVADLEAETGHAIKLDAEHYKGFTQEQLDKMVKDGLWNEEQLGRLKVTTANGLNEDGEYEALYSYGGRSFSVYETEDFEQLYDSGDEFEQITSEALPKNFNSSNDDNAFKNRSDDKGPEPETAEVGEINGKQYAFIGLERQGGIMVYDIDNPKEPQFVTYFTSRDFSSEDGSVKGDSAPEGLKFVAANDSATGKAMLLAAHEVSGTVVAYEIENLTGEERLAGTAEDDEASGESKAGKSNLPNWIQYVYEKLGIEQFKSNNGQSQEIEEANK